MNVRHRLTAVATAVATMASVVVFMAPPSGALPGDLMLPFSPGETWFVCQGYKGIPSHGSTYGLDLTTYNSAGRNGCWGGQNHAAGKAIYASGGGNATQTGMGGVCVNLDGGGSMWFGHLNERRGNGRVERGTFLGRVAPAGQADNGDYAHLHIDLSHSTGCSRGRATVPFSSAGGGTPFECGVELPDIGGRNQHRLRSLTRCNTATVTPPPVPHVNPASLIGKLVQWDGDRAPRPSWFVTRDGRRAYVPSMDVWNCLRENGAEDAGPQTAAVLNALPDMNGTHAICGRDWLNANEVLWSAAHLQSTSGRFRLSMQGDGNLVLYDMSRHWTDRSRVMWATNRHGGTHVAMQGDSNLVVYNGHGQPIWWTGQRRGGRYLVLQDDGNLVMYACDHRRCPVWWTGTVR